MATLYSSIEATLENATLDAGRVRSMEKRTPFQMAVTRAPQLRIELDCGNTILIDGPEAWIDAQVAAHRALRCDCCGELPDLCVGVTA